MRRYKYALLSELISDSDRHFPYNNQFCWSWHSMIELFITVLWNKQVEAQCESASVLCCEPVLSCLYTAVQANAHLLCLVSTPEYKPMFSRSVLSLHYPIEVQCKAYCVPAGVLCRYSRNDWQHVILPTEKYSIIHTKLTVISRTVLLPYQ